MLAIFELSSFISQSPTKAIYSWWRADKFGTFENVEQARAALRANEVTKECPNAFIVRDAQHLYVLEPA